MPESATPTYEELQQRPPSAVALALCTFLVVVVLVADVVWAADFPTPMLMATSLLSGVAAMIFTGMAWTYRLSRASLWVFGLGAVIGIAVICVNIFTLWERAISE